LFIRKAQTPKPALEKSESPKEKVKKKKKIVLRKTTQ
jgi:hypothetical protein